MNLRLLTAALVLAVALPTIGQAQLGPDRPHRDKRRAEIEARVRTMKIWKLTDELELSEEQAARFFPLMNEMEAAQDQIEEQRRQALDQLGDLVWKEEADADQINGLLDKLEELAHQQMELRQKFRKDAAGVLTPAQMGKLVLFNHQFPALMRDLIREFEDRPGARPPSGRSNRW